jgi:hypothetical protein
MYISQVCYGAPGRAGRSNRALNKEGAVVAHATRPGPRAAGPGKVVGERGQAQHGRQGGLDTLRSVGEGACEVGV